MHLCSLDMDFLDTREGSVHRIWINDEIAVKFSDRSTARMKMIGPRREECRWDLGR